MPCASCQVWLSLVWKDACQGRQCGSRWGGEHPTFQEELGIPPMSCPGSKGVLGLPWPCVLFADLLPSIPKGVGSAASCLPAQGSSLLDGGCGPGRGPWELCATP